MAISVLNERIDFLTFLDKYLYMRMLFQEIDARKSCSGRLVHDMSVKTLKEVLLCNNNEAVKVRQTLKALEWVIHIDSATLQLPAGKGRKKLPAVLKHESHVRSLTSQADDWQYYVVRGLLLSPPGGKLWSAPPEAVVGCREDRSATSFDSKKKSASSNITKLPIIERMILAVLWATASPAGLVEGLSLNAVARQCSLKPSKRFKLAISNLIVDGAIVYHQERVCSSDQFGRKISFPTEIQLNPFHPLVSVSVPRVTMLVLESKNIVDATGPSEMAMLSELTGLGTLYDQHSAKHDTNKKKRRQHLEAVMTAKDPYNHNGIRKKWSNRIENLSTPDVRHANDRWVEFQVPTNLKPLHDDAIVMQKLICTHLKIITLLSIKYGDLCLSDNLITINADSVYISDILPEQHKKLITGLPLFAIKNLIAAEDYFKNGVLKVFLKKIDQEHMESIFDEMYSRDLVVFPPIKPKYFHNAGRLIDAYLSLTILSPTEKSSSEKQVIRFAEGKSPIKDCLSFLNPNDIRDIR
jgi:hypothetical protein